jgi:hypothetical protein
MLSALLTLWSVAIATLFTGLEPVIGEDISETKALG